MIFVFYPNAFKIASGLSLEVEFAAAHEEITFWAWTDVLTLLIDHFGIADGTEVPPVFFLL